jgi:hypothetical protein
MIENAGYNSQGLEFFRGLVTVGLADEADVAVLDLFLQHLADHEERSGRRPYS